MNLNKPKVRMAGYWEIQLQHYLVSEEYPGPAATNTTAGVDGGCGWEYA